MRTLSVYCFMQKSIDSTLRFPRISLLTPLLIILIHFPLHILCVFFSWHYRYSLTCALVHLKVTSALVSKLRGSGGILCSREPWLHTHAEQAFWGQCESFCRCSEAEWACPLSNMTPDHYFLELLHKLLCCLRV